MFPDYSYPNIYTSIPLAVITLTFCVVALSPVIASSALSKNKIIRSENLTKWTGSDTVHGSGLEINKDGSGNIFAAAGLVVVNVDPLQLEVGVPMVGSGGVDAVLIGDNLPELKKKIIKI